MYKELEGQVRQALSRAAVFLKVDLHVHTGESYDFPGLSDKMGGVSELIPEDNTENASELLSRMRLAERRVDVVAITDHNKCKNACQLASAPGEGHLILPGMEITVQCAELTPESVHIVALFPPGLQPEDIEQVFYQSGMPPYAQRGAESRVTDLQIAELVRRIREDLNGICIAAHANSNAGIRHHVRTTSIRSLAIRREIIALEQKLERSLGEEQRLTQLRLEQTQVEDQLQDKYLTFLARASFNAVEIQKPEDQGHYAEAHCAPLNVKPIACLLSSDAHCPRDVGLPGYTTYLKMGEPSIDGIRRALEDPVTRIRFEEEKRHTRVITGIRFCRTNGDEAGGFFRDETVGFSDDLSCLIGGRGSGKSAVIDALRFVFMIDPETIRDEKRRDDVRRRQAKTLAGTEVRVLLRVPDGQSIILVRRYHSESPGPTRLYSTDGTELDIGNLPETDYGKVSLYGWSEIEDLATNESEQRELIDGFIPELRPLILAKGNAVVELQTNREAVTRTVREVRRLLPGVADLKQLQHELDAIDTEEMRVVFEEADSAHRRAGVMQLAVEGISDLKARFLDENQQPLDMAGIITGRWNALAQSLRDAGLDEAAVSDRKEDVAKIAADAESHYTALLEKLDELQRLPEQEYSASLAVQAAAERDLVDKAKGTYGEKLLSGQMTEEEVIQQVGKRGNLKQRVNGLELIQAKVDRLKDEVHELLQRRRDQLLPALVAARLAVSEKREEKVGDINQQLKVLAGKAAVSVRVIQDGDRSAFAAELGADEKENEGILHGCGIYSWRDRGCAQQLADHVLPSEFARAVMDNDAQGICVPSAHGESGVSTAEAERIVSHLRPSDEDGWYDADKLDTLLRLQELEVEDLPVISLDETPIKDRSPGQRCTALVPIILLQGDEPLIIDQPEDNLDNRLIFDVVVDVLRSLKGRRQVIAATHNPNIAVSGDAEQIVVLEALSKDQGRPAVQGCIDQDDVIAEVTDVMEGGKEAFETRALKYNYWITARP